VYATWTLGAFLLNAGSAIKVVTQGFDSSNYILHLYAIIPFILYAQYPNCNISCFLTIAWTSIGCMANGSAPEAIFPFLTSLMVLLVIGRKQGSVFLSPRSQRSPRVRTDGQVTEGSPPPTSHRLVSTTVIV